MKRSLLTWLYRQGALRAFHSWRNRSTLTVVLFHRVLPFDTALPRNRWPNWTVTPAFLEQCLDFFSTHYNVVEFSRILTAIEGGMPLPPRALLLTFDDGWRDTAEIAAPILRHRGLPCLLFAVGRLGSGEELWQEPLIRAWMDRPGEGFWPELWRAAGNQPLPSSWSFETLQQLIAILDPLDPSRRAAMLEPLGLDPPYSAAMMDAALLRAFAQRGFEVGTHGLSHVPMTLAGDPLYELAESRRTIAGLLNRSPDSIRTLSWPHGRYSSALVAAAFNMGYQCIFTSDKILNSTRSGIPSPILGRIEPAMEYCADSAGNLLAEVLAALLFRLPQRSLTQQQ